MSVSTCDGNKEPTTVCVVLEGNKSVRVWRVFENEASAESALRRRAGTRRLSEGAWVDRFTTFRLVTCEVGGT